MPSLPQRHHKLNYVVREPYLIAYFRYSLKSQCVTLDLRSQDIAFYSHPLQNNTIFMTTIPIIKHTLYLLTSIVLLASCSVAKQVPYFQDIVSDSTLAVIPEPVTIRLRPQDKISILVNSRDPQLMTLFNLPVIQRYIGSNVPISNGNNNLAGYTIDRSGDIDFPVLGKLRLAGMTREEAAAYIKNELISNNLIKDPVVTVEFMNLTISVMGEVNKPGRYNIDKDQITIFDALSMAGDLTIYGLREHVTVMRQVDGEQKIYELNLTSAQDVLASPVFYLQQNDFIYVEPNKMRANQATVNGNSFLSSSFWVSVASLLVSLGVLIFN